MSLLLLLIISVICGVISSTPPGPINLYIAQKVLLKNNHGRSSILLGIVFADVLFAALAFTGYYTFLKDNNIEKWIITLGSLLIIVLGIIQFIQNRKEVLVSKGKQPAISSLASFIKGFLLCGSNPGFLLWWVFVASKYSEFSITVKSLFDVVVVISGIALGDFLWFRLYIWLMERGSGNLQPKNIILFQKIVSLLLVVLGIFSLITVFS